MPQRNLNYRKLKALEDERQLGYLQALSDIGDRTHWDPTSEIPGTGPEKEVYNYLVRIGVRFEFQYHMLDLPATAFPEDIWIPDFILPDYGNTIIEVYGYYWHSVPKRREGDQLKKAYWLQSGYTVYEHGIPLYPSGGSAAGKAIIWWDYEIYQNLDHLFSRDLPEVFTSRVAGQPEEYILDAEEEKRRLAAQKAAKIAVRIRPRLNPYEKHLRSLRKKLFDIEKTNPILRELREYAQPKIPKKLYSR